MESTIPVPAARAAEINQQVTGHYPLALTLAKKFRLPAHSPFDNDDLVQEVALALLETADRFNPQMGAKFSTYAYSCIKGKLLNVVGRENSRPATEEFDEIEKEPGDYWEVGQPHSYADNYEKATTLVEAIKTLTPLQANMFKAACEGSSTTDIAIDSGVSLPPVSNVMGKCTKTITAQVQSLRQVA
jgi:RNA polymerase sigma factor (sigma-70 family)